jgi:hypothetical protein
MTEPAGLTPELRLAWNNAWSVSPDQTPSGVFIGAVKTENTTFYYYKDGENYYYENDFDRQMRVKQKEKKQQQMQQQYSIKNRYGAYARR